MRLGAVRMTRDDDGWWIVSDVRTLAWGEGRTRRRALWDYLLSLRDLWQLGQTATRRHREELEDGIEQH